MWGLGRKYDGGGVIAMTMMMMRRMLYGKD